MGSKAVIEYVGGEDDGLLSVVDVKWLIDNGAAVEWRKGMKPWKTYAIRLLHQG